MQNFCVLVEFVNFRPFNSIEQDAEFLHPNNLCTRALIASADFQGSHRVLFFLHLLERSELLLASSTDCQVATVKKAFFTEPVWLLFETLRFSLSTV